MFSFGQRRQRDLQEAKQHTRGVRQSMREDTIVSLETTACYRPETARQAVSRHLAGHGLAPVKALGKSLAVGTQFVQ